jgi:hypothetical protein
LIEIKPIKKEKLPTCHSIRLAEARGSTATPFCDGVGSPRRRLSLKVEKQKWIPNETSMDADREKKRCSHPKQ